MGKLWFVASLKTNLITSASIQMTYPPFHLYLFQLSKPLMFANETNRQKKAEHFVDFPFWRNEILHFNLPLGCLLFKLFHLPLALSNHHHYTFCLTMCLRGIWYSWLVGRQRVHHHRLHSTSSLLLFFFSKITQNISVIVFPGTRTHSSSRCASEINESILASLKVWSVAGGGGCAGGREGYLNLV